MSAAVHRWIVAHRRVIALKACVAALLTYSHYYPGTPLGLAVNLLWLALF